MSIFDNVEFDDSSDGFKIGGGAFSVIPEGTKVRALSESVEYEPKNDRNKEWSPDGVVKVQWRILEPEAIKNRIVFQNLYVHGALNKDGTPNNDKVMKHRQVLLAMDKYSNGEATIKDGKTDLKGVQNSILDLTISVYVKNNGDQGNYVSGVYRKGSLEPEMGVEKPKKSSGGGSFESDFGDIPF